MLFRSVVLMFKQLFDYFSYSNQLPNNVVLMFKQLFDYFSYSNQLPNNVVLMFKQLFDYFSYSKKSPNILIFTKQNKYLWLLVKLLTNIFQILLNI